MTDDEAPYQPKLSADDVERLRAWHEAAYEELRSRGEIRLTYLGLELVVPADVFAPTPMSDLLGSAVREEVRQSDRVLDMGTGCGVNAILAASKSRDVTGVDINPHAIEAAVANAARNGVAGRARFIQSDLFNRVDGTFDLVIFDPPFRWFRARDLLEASIADENYQALGRFFAEVPARLRPDGRILLFFGTSGDVGFVSDLIRAAQLSSETVRTRTLQRPGMTVMYSTQRLTRTT